MLQIRKFRKVAFFALGASVAGAALVVAACGTDNGNPVATPQIDGGGGKDTGPGADTGPAPDTGAPSDAGTEADCSANPRLSNNPEGAFRCSFVRFDAGTDGGSSNCKADETCCNPADKVGGEFQPSFCATGKGEAACKSEAAGHSSSFDAGTAWECADKNACTDGKICCMIQDPARLALDPDNKLDIGRTPNNHARHPPACNVQMAYNAGGSRCKAPIGNNCAADEIKLCSMGDNTCGAGTVCTPFTDFAGTWRGFCKPTQ